jgi:hypothetical protein
MSLVDIVTLDDTWSDIHATPAVLNPQVGRRHPGDAMAIITCVATPHESLEHIVNYVWHLLESMFPPNACPVPDIPPRHPAVAAHTVSSKPPLRGTVPRGRKQASTDDGWRSIPAGVNGRGCAASLRGSVAAARYATGRFACYNVLVRGTTRATPAVLPPYRGQAV